MRPLPRPGRGAATALSPKAPLALSGRTRAKPWNSPSRSAATPRGGSGIAPSLKWWQTGPELRGAAMKKRAIASLCVGAGLLAAVAPADANSITCASARLLAAELLVEKGPGRIGAPGISRARLLPGCTREQWKALGRGGHLGWHIANFKYAWELHYPDPPRWARQCGGVIPIYLHPSGHLSGHVTVCRR